MTISRPSSHYLNKRHSIILCPCPRCRSALYTIKKTPSESIDKYTSRIKALVDKLAATSVSLEDEEILVHTLNGLLAAFNAFRTSIRTRNDNISLEELHTLFISEETTMAKTSAIEAIPTAMAAFHPPQHHDSRGRGRRFHSTGNPNFNSSPNSSNRGTNFASGSRGLGSNNNFGTQPNHFRPNYNNHDRFLPPSHFTSVHPNQRGIIGSSPSYGPSFRPETNFGYNGRIFCQICHKQGHGALDCYNRMNFSYQGRHPPSQLAAMTVNSMNSQISGENTNNFWLPDSGCNVHMTNELANLNLSNNYNGEETVTVENSQPLNIENTGSVDTGNKINATTINLPDPPPPRNTHAMQTRAKSCIFKPKAFHITTASQLPHHIQKPPNIQNGELRCMRNSMLFKHKETVYVAQPTGFQDKTCPNHVCLLHKSLYGLQKVPHACRILSHLLLYVDDIIVTGPDYLYISVFKNQLALEFKISDLGPLKYFLGLEIQSSIDGIFVNQAKYLNDLLHTSGMTSAKSCITPMSTSLDLYTIAPPFNDPSLYRRLVGSLQCLTFTRSDIAFSVNRVSQFMHKPTVIHFLAVKRILRYLRGTPTLGIKFEKVRFLYKFCDFDWAGDTSDRRSTSGFIAFFGSNPISWSSKKKSTVSRSCIEAEYRSLATTTADLYWIRQLLCDLHVPLKTSPTLWCDNVFAISLAHNPVFHARHQTH
ncbi:putative mitochondrial protein [Cucumis melo var. makuwa]|uniref:Putative mitochondrial protein n=1 Tax=Cucumis melo var. makuwa TaxID=1194695 RepID=A0A5D3C579_CUCMM|nr:putative mitochondrial protein [Cucumis melo var. makuwa]